MDHAETEHVIASADVFLNGEYETLPRDPYAIHSLARHYARDEAERFRNVLETYLGEKIDAGDYLTE